MDRTFLDNDCFAWIMYDSNFTYSLVTQDFVLAIEFMHEWMMVPFKISTLVGHSVVFNLFCYGVWVNFDRYNFLCSLLALYMMDFNVILGMD